MFGKLATRSLIASKFQVQNKYIRSLDNFDEQLSRVDFVELFVWRAGDNSNFDGASKLDHVEQNRGK